MKRKRLWTPQWEGAIEGWTINFITRNLWRTTPHHDFDDLYQDGYIYFITCKARYPEVVDPPHFMRLYQISLQNHLHTLSSERTADFKSRGGSSNHDTLEGLEAKQDSSLQKELELLLVGAPPALLAALSGDIYLGFLRDFGTGWRETNDGRLRRIFGEHLYEVLTWLRQQKLISAKI